MRTEPMTACMPELPLDFPPERRVELTFDAGAEADMHAFFWSLLSPRSARRSTVAMRPAKAEPCMMSDAAPPADIAGLLGVRDGGGRHRDL